MKPQWVAQGANILTPESLDLVKQALTLGPILGRHYHYAGGSSADTWIFLNYQDFNNYLLKSRPGDLFTVWSLPDLIAKNIMLLQIASAYTDTVTSVSSVLNVVKDYLRTPYSEFAVVFVPISNGGASIQIDDIDGYDALCNHISKWQGNGDIYIFPFTLMDTDQYIILKAKYPDSMGRVPLGGTY